MLPRFSSWTEARAPAYDVRAEFTVPGGITADAGGVTSLLLPPTSTQAAVGGGVDVRWTLVAPGTSLVNVDVPAAVDEAVRAGAVMSLLVNVSWRSRPAAVAGGLREFATATATLQAVKPAVAEAKMLVGSNDVAVEPKYAVILDDVVMEVRADVPKSTSVFSVQLALAPQVEFVEARYTKGPNIIAASLPGTVVTSAKDPVTGTTTVVASFGSITNTGPATEQIVLTVEGYLRDVVEAKHGLVIGCVPSVVYDGTKDDGSAVEFTPRAADILNKMTIDTSASGGVADAEDSVTCTGTLRLSLLPSRYIVGGKYTDNGVHAYVI